MEAERSWCDGCGDWKPHFDGFCPVCRGSLDPIPASAIAAIKAEQREADAKICDARMRDAQSHLRSEERGSMRNNMYGAEAYGAQMCASAIRARGEEET